MLKKLKSLDVTNSRVNVFRAIAIMFYRIIVTELLLALAFPKDSVPVNFIINYVRWCIT